MSACQCMCSCQNAELSLVVTTMRAGTKALEAQQKGWANADGLQAEYLRLKGLLDAQKVTDLDENREDLDQGAHAYGALFERGFGRVLHLIKKGCGLG